MLLWNRTAAVGSGKPHAPDELLDELQAPHRRSDIAASDRRARLRLTGRSPR